MELLNLKTPTYIFFNQVIMGFPHCPSFKRDYFGFYLNEHTLPRMKNTLTPAF